jgi:hypothetical protein
MFFEKLFLKNVNISENDIISMKVAKVQIKWEDNQPLNLWILKTSPPLPQC